MRRTQGVAARTPGQPGTRAYKRLAALAQRTSPVVIAASEGYIEDLHGVWHVWDVPMNFFGPPAERVDPGEAVMLELDRSGGFIRDLEQKIRDMEEQDLVWGKVSEMEETRTGGQGGDYTLVREEIRAEISAWWVMLERERKHYATVAASAVRAGLEERRLRLAERSVDVLEAAMMMALQDAGYDPHDSNIRQALGLRLQQAIESGQVIDGRLAGPVPEPVPVTVVSERAGQDSGLQPVDF